MRRVRRGPVQQRDRDVKHWVRFVGSICLKLGDDHTAIFLWWGKGGRLDPRAGEPISTRDSNRGRGEDDYPVELFGNRNATADKRRGAMATRSRGALPHHPHFHSTTLCLTVVFPRARNC